MKNKKEGEHTRYVVGVFIIICLGCFFTSMVFFEDDKTIEGIALFICGVLFSCISIWTYFNPFYPVLIGLLFSISFCLILISNYPKQVIEHTHGKWGSPLFYMLFGLGLIIHSLIMGYKEWKSKK